MMNTDAAAESATAISSSAPTAEPIRVEAAPILAVELPNGERRAFTTSEEIRAAILAGVVPRDASVLNSTQKGVQPVRTVEAWAKANDRLRPLYEPVWSATLKGALIGALVVAALKCLDTFIVLASLNGGAALLFVLMVAFLVSPKWKPQIAFAGFMVLKQSNLAFGVINMLFGMWFGVCVFAAVFGISSGMAVGTAVGYARAKRITTAPDALPEGRKPLIWGLTVPLSFFLVAGFVYWQFVMPALIRSLQ